MFLLLKLLLYKWDFEKDEFTEKEKKKEEKKKEKDEFTDSETIDWCSYSTDGCQLM